jgi:ABC-type transporter Mla MlaB component
MRKKAGGTGRAAKAAGHDVATLRLEGELGLEQVAELQGELLERLVPGGAVVIDASGLQAVDLAGVQLLLSAARTAAALGCRLSVDRLGNPAWSSAATRAGLAADQLTATRFAPSTRNG